MIRDRWRAVMALKRVARTLRRLGWFRSAMAKAPLDARGEELPLYTYAMISFLEPRLSGSFRVFEYGSGHSTIWYARRVGEVTSVENHSGWTERVRARLRALGLDNAEVVYRGEGGEAYVGAVRAGGKAYHLVSIDGRARAASTRAAVGCLTDNGVIVFDDAQRERYAETHRFLQERGFKRIDFTGFKPQVPEVQTTTVFYRPENVLGI